MVTTVRDWQLPPKDQAWTHAVRDPTDARMRALSEEIRYGLKYPKSGRHDDAIIRELPRRKHPRLTNALGTQGWGLHVAMGFSYRRFLWWMAACAALCVVYAALWLHFIDHTQVTTALAPPGIFLTLLTLALTVAQKTEDVWHPLNGGLPDLAQSIAGPGVTRESSTRQITPTLQDTANSSSSSYLERSQTQSASVTGVPDSSRRRIPASESRV